MVAFFVPLFIFSLLGQVPCRGEKLFIFFEKNWMLSFGRNWLDLHRCGKKVPSRINVKNQQKLILCQILAAHNCKGHRPLSLKVPYIEFEFDVKFLTLLQPCKQYIKILRRITHLHAIIRPHWNFWCICHNLHHAITYIEVEFDIRYFLWCPHVKSFKGWQCSFLTKSLALDSNLLRIVLSTYQSKQKLMLVVF